MIKHWKHPRFLLSSEWLHYWLYYSFELPGQRLPGFHRTFTTELPQESVSVILPQLRAEWAGLWSGFILDTVSQVAASSLPSLVFHSDSDLHLTPQNIKLHNPVPIPNLSAVVPPSTLLRKKQSSTFLSSESASYWSSGTHLRRGMSLGIHAVLGYYRARHTTGGHFLGNLSAWSRNLTKELRNGAGSRGMQRTAWSSVCSGSEPVCRNCPALGVCRT